MFNNKNKKMTLQKLLEEAQNRYHNGYSESRLVDFVFENANNETQAEIILWKILKKPNLK
tara:strand:+ start:7071 stop:7250 length:180 start_codon:yes stop_codon:yes gene_type:complete